MIPPRAGAAGGEWLDRLPWLPIVLILLLPWIVHLPQWILGLSTDPIWNESRLALAVHPGLVGGRTDIDPAAGWNTEALGHLAAWDWVHGIVPWWNPYSGIGMPLAGEMQPSAFFLPFNLLLLLPDGVLWLKIATQTVAGLAAYALLRALGLGRLASLAGAALYPLNGTVAWFADAPAFPASFLPLVLLGIEYARRRAARLAGLFWIAVGIAWMIFAGFPETAYIGGLLALPWAACRFVQAPAAERGAFAAAVLAGGVLGLLLTAPLLVAFADFLFAARTYAEHGAGALTLSWHGFPVFVLPYAYGFLVEAFGNARLARIWYLGGGYAGILLLFFAALGLFGRRDRALRMTLLAWVVLAWAKTFGIPPVQQVLNAFPFVYQTNIVRYAPPVWSLALTILAAFALEDFRERPRRLLPPLAIVLALLGLAVRLAWPADPFWGWHGRDSGTMFVFLGIVLAAALAALAAAVAMVRLLAGERRRHALAALLVVYMAGLFIIPELAGVHGGRLDTAATRYLRNHLGLARFYSLGPFEPDYGAFFRIPSINHIALPVAARWSDYIARQLFPPIQQTAGFLFWSAAPYPPGSGLAALREYFPHYEDVGVRFVLSEPGQSLQPIVAVPAGQSGNRPLALGPGQEAEAAFPAPAPPRGAGPVASVGVDIGNYLNAADGRLAVRLCDATGCAGGSLPLAGSADDALFFVPLAKPREYPPGAPLRLTIRHEGGTNPVALWLWPVAGRSGQALRGPSGPLPDQSLRLALRYQDPGFPLRAVYSDAIMTIWRTPHPGPYFSIEAGGPCALRVASRRILAARCSSPATLIRRELFMPGWTARVNSKPVAVAPSGEIFQSLVLPAGESEARFSFAPPGILWGWIAAAIGAAGLVLALVASLRAQAGAARRATATASRASP